jgi:multidrug efflux pump
MSPSLRIVVTGLIAQHPFMGGVTWDYLQYALGLRRLGHDVYYLEDSGEWPYNIDGGPSGIHWAAQDCRFNVAFLARIMERFGLDGKWAYHCALESQWYGLSDRRRNEILSSADLLLNVSGTLEWREEYRRVSRLCYIDSDPLFTQVKLALAQAGGAMPEQAMTPEDEVARQVLKDALTLRDRIARYDVHFSFGEDLSVRIPETGIRWLPTRQPISLAEWKLSAPSRNVFTTVMNWTSYEPLRYFPHQLKGNALVGLDAPPHESDILLRHEPLRNIDEEIDSKAQGRGFFYGGSYGDVFVVLKPLSERQVSAQEVANRLQPELDRISGAEVDFGSVQEVRIGARASHSQYEYALLGEDNDELYEWAPKIAAALKTLPNLRNVHLDQKKPGLEANLTIDRPTAARLGITVSQITNTLYDAFGQRQVSTIYKEKNQYHVVMEVAPEFWQSPDVLSQIYVSTGGDAVSGAQGTQPLAGTVVANASTAKSSVSATTATAQIAGNVARNVANNVLANTARSPTSTGSAVSTSPEMMVPLSAFSRFETKDTPHAVYHQNLFAASTISFNLAPSVSLSGATAAINDRVARLGVPTSIHGIFQGTAKAFQQSLSNEPVLIAAALLAVYIVLGMLYESYVHPITVLSTLPSAGAGAVLALIATHTEFSIMALLGVILLIGIVKKNAIMMIDFALDAERSQGLSPQDAIYEACVKRFRPIIMTTMAAMLGAVPLAIGFGEGAELRRPLGITIVGGLIVSQLLTLYTTPVVYLYLDHFRLRARRPWRTHRPPLADKELPQPGE